MQVLQSDEDDNTADEEYLLNYLVCDIIFSYYVCIIKADPTYISDAHIGLLIKSCLNYVWTIWTNITYIHTNTM